MHSPIISSMLDIDLYKLTMMQVVYRDFRDSEAQYALKARRPLPEIDWQTALTPELKALTQLRFKDDDLDYLSQLGCFESDFLNFLADFKLQKDAVSIARGNQLSMTIRGGWVDTILFEVPLLSIVTELTGQIRSTPNTLAIAEQKLAAKLAALSGNTPLPLIEFGTRRRYSKAWHAQVLKALMAHPAIELHGTSNVALAKSLGLRPLGTMAHEYLQAAQRLESSLLHHQRLALTRWAKHYPTSLQVALTDVIGIRSFVDDMDPALWAHYTGFRHDSGCPHAFIEVLCQGLKANGIAPKDKEIIFSNGLTLSSASALHAQYQNDMSMSFGIGTHLTYDTDHRAPDVVIKMTHINGEAVAKLSDSPGKVVCDDEHYLATIKSELNWRPTCD